MSTNEDALRRELDELKKQFEAARPKWTTTCGTCGSEFTVYTEVEGRARNPKCPNCRPKL